MCTLELAFRGDSFLLNRRFLTENEFELLGDAFYLSPKKAASVEELGLAGLWELVPGMHKPPGTSGLSDLYMALIIAGGTLFLVTLVICCYCWCCRKGRDSRIRTSHPTSQLTRNDGDWTKKESGMSMIGPPNKAFSQYSHYDSKSLKKDKNF